MKKTTLLLSIFCIALLLSACGSKNSNSSESMDLTGSWEEADAGSDAYYVLELNADGSGSLITMPMDIAVPLNYEIEGSSIMTHMGSDDDNTPMEYLTETDQIQYNDIVFNRK